MSDRDKYQILDTDREHSPGTYHPYYPDPVIAHSGQVEPLIDGATYFNDLYATIDSLSGNIARQGIYLMNWNFDKNFEIQPGLLLTDYLKSKASSGIDVRVLVWVSEHIVGQSQSWNLPFDFDPYIPVYLYDKLGQTRDWLLKDEQYWKEVMRMNLETLVELRQEPLLAEKAQANTLDCPAGSSHAKFALVFDEFFAFGFTGGMDFVSNRISDSIHFQDLNGWNNVNGWHDIQAKVYGEICQELFDFFRDMWNELVYLKDNAAQLGYTVPSFNAGTVIGTTPNAADVPAQVMPFAGSVQHYVQSLRTLPHKTRVSCTLPGDTFDFRFAPNGAYEIHLAVKKAIENAETYIYIEDQAMLSRQILGYLKNAVIANPDLKVILLTGQLDPDVPQDDRNYTIPHYFLDGLSPTEKDRVAIYVHNCYVHSKLFLVDDKFALIGSAGMYNRAMFVEIEHSVSFVDQNPLTESVKQFRLDLWSEHFKLLPLESTQIINIADALSIWNPTWGSAAPGFKLPVWGQNLLELPADLRNIDGQDIPVCLVPFRIFKTDNSGTVVPGNSTGYTGVNYQNNNALINSSGPDFIDDAGLPDHSEKNLEGRWVLIISGPNAGNMLRITSHTGTAIGFQPQAQAFDNSTVYRVYKPFLDKIEITTGALSYAEWLYTFEHWTDCGELP